MSISLKKSAVKPAAIPPQALSQSDRVDDFFAAGPIESVLAHRPSKNGSDQTKLYAAGKVRTQVKEDITPQVALKPSLFPKDAKLSCLRSDAHSSRSRRVHRRIESPPSSPSNFSLLQELRERRAKIQAENILIEQQINALLPPNPDDDFVQSEVASHIASFVDVEATVSGDEASADEDEHEDEEDIQGASDGDEDNDEISEEGNDEEVDNITGAGVASPANSEAPTIEIDPYSTGVPDGGSSITTFDNTDDMDVGHTAESDQPALVEATPQDASATTNVTTEHPEDGVFLDNGTLFGRQNPGAPASNTQSMDIEFDEEYDNNFALLGAMQQPSLFRMAKIYTPGYPNRNLAYAYCHAYKLGDRGKQFNFLCIEAQDALADYPPAAGRSLVSALLFDYIPEKIANLGRVPIEVLAAEHWQGHGRSGDMLVWEDTKNIVLFLLPGMAVHSNIVNPRKVTGSGHTLTYHGLTVAPCEQEFRSATSIAGHFFGFKSTTGPIEPHEDCNYLNLLTDSQYGATASQSKGKTSALPPGFDANLALGVSGSVGRKSPIKGKGSTLRGIRPCEKNVAVYNVPGWMSTREEYDVLMNNPTSLPRHHGEIPIDSLVIAGCTMHTNKKTDGNYPPSLVINTHFVLLLGAPGDNINTPSYVRVAPSVANSANVGMDKGNNNLAPPVEHSTQSQRAEVDFVEPIPASQAPTAANNMTKAATPSSSGPKRKAGKSTDAPAAKRTAKQSASAPVARRASTRSSTKAGAKSVDPSA